MIDFLKLILTKLYVIIDLAQTKTYLANSKKGKKMYELNCHFHHSLVAKLPMAKYVVSVDG